MKKLSSLFTLAIFIFLLGGCDLINHVTPPSTNPPATQTYTIKDYFPFNANEIYYFEGSGNEYATYTSWIDYINNDRIQVRTNNGGTEVVKILENKDGQLKSIFSLGECYYRENLTSAASNKDEILLKEPLVNGTSWTLTTGEQRYISNTSVSVTANGTTYSALEITTKYADSQTMDYYALNVGLIKTVFKSNDTEVSSTLKTISKDAAFEQTVKFYYLNSKTEKLSYVEKTLSFKTNDVTRQMFQNYFRDPGNASLTKLIGSNVTINSLYLNKDGMVYVDFSSNFVSEMNLGSYFETQILQGITNTLGTYYGVDKVYITIDNQPYSSGHIEIKKGEYFKVSNENIPEFNP